MRIPTPLLFGAALLATTGCAAGARPATSTTTTAMTAATGDVPSVVFHKTATCACCGEYLDYLEADGVELEVVVHEDLEPLKAKLGVRRINAPATPTKWATSSRRVDSTTTSTPAGRTGATTRTRGGGPVRPARELVHDLVELATAGGAQRTALAAELDQPDRSPRSR